MGRIRLSINLLTGHSTPSRVGSFTSSQHVNRLNGKNFASTIVQRVGLTYAESRYKEFKNDIAFQIQRDVEREIQNVARQYNTLVVGAANKRTSRATIYSRLEGGPQEYFARNWAPLSPKYAAWKANKGYPAGHFELTGRLGTVMKRGNMWTQLFGPVRVDVIRTAGNVPAQNVPTIRSGYTGRFAIANIRVHALGRVDANMLPALAGMPNVADGRDTGLIGLVHSRLPRLAWKIGGNRNTPYRPTLEPFLSFLLTKAIPSAVHNRVSALVRTGNLRGSRFT